MGKKNIKTLFLFVAGIIITTLSILLVLLSQKKHDLVQTLDSVQAMNDTLETRMNMNEGLTYFHNYIIFTADTSAYKHLISEHYGMQNLPYSIYIADHCDNGDACYYVYDEISNLLDGIVDLSLRMEATQMAIYYLKKGAKLNNRRCAHTLSGMYIKGDHVACDTVLGKKYLEQAVRPEQVEVEYETIKNSDYSWF